MPWNWTQPDWPHFRYDASALAALEQRFLLSSGEVIGAVRHIDPDDRDRLRIELLSDEAVKTSAIEGETLDRLSVQSSLRRQLGLDPDRRSVQPREHGIAEMTVDVYGTYALPLDDATLFRWHTMLMAGSRHLESIGAYRSHSDAMQIVSGQLNRPTIHFEAPPSAQVPEEMHRFISWFNASALAGGTPLPALTRAGLSHLWFESIHPFEDGNGRLGRALAEKALAQSLGQPSLIMLSFTIEQKRKAYYDQLEIHQRTLDVTEWLVWFSQTVLTAQQTTLDRVAFYIAKAHFYDRFRGAFNTRQEKVIARLFEAGPDGFIGGLSADNYLAITKTSRATATRDLQDLVDKGALTRSGQLRFTRYALNWRPHGHK
ncbi:MULTISPECIES: Fic family protein [Brucella]|uniref:Fic family protein n=1 Tax=Brucella pecoris TaxID=867683 RepID=A0A5C5CCQ3_9HYPH|nr:MULTISPECIES: Fic family protein [Brucella]MBB4096223.1 Fic family protein [Brucella pecoris]MDG9793361.1 Fic family protein [Brucella anthropi]MDH0819761.1 Fic family protein [Brucella anthropi]MDH2086407.1 Fic family protein [Brucella anthropi]TNV08725.1 Fic family protein [Brucella pecoris]